jgi:hypothetical protein
MWKRRAAVNKLSAQSLFCLLRACLVLREARLPLDSAKIHRGLRLGATTECWLQIACKEVGPGSRVTACRLLILKAGMPALRPMLL